MTPHPAVLCPAAHLTRGGRVDANTTAVKSRAFPWFPAWPRACP